MFELDIQPKLIMKQGTIINLNQNEKKEKDQLIIEVCSRVI